MQRLDKILKQFNLPKVCTQRIYECLCIPRGSVFHYAAAQNGCIEVSLDIYPDMYVVHKSTEHWVWVIHFKVVGKKFHLERDKYIKKRIWVGAVPYIDFNDHGFYLNPRMRLPKEMGLIHQ